MATKRYVVGKKHKARERRGKVATGAKRHHSQAGGVSEEELKDAFRVVPGQLMTAQSWNNRFNLLLDILFGADPATLRKQLVALMEEKQAVGLQENPSGGPVI